MMSRARRFAPGRGDLRASIRDSAPPNERHCVNERGDRSLVVREKTTVGSWVVVLRRDISGGRRVGWIMGIFEAVKGQYTYSMVEVSATCV
jgi:hypothetical protein